MPELPEVEIVKKSLKKNVKDKKILDVIAVSYTHLTLPTNREV